jgi:glutaredoxin
MRSSVCTAAALAAALAAAFPAWGQTNVYKWTDSQGKVHFSDTPPSEPAKNVTQKRVGSANVEVSQLPYATQLAMKNNPVTLYTAPQCGDPCANGRTLLSERGIPYTERDAQANPNDAQALKKLIGALQVPVLVIGSEPMKGYDSNAWHVALDTAGYPRTRLPGTLTPKPVIAPAPPPPPQPPAPAQPPESDAAPPGK